MKESRVRCRRTLAAVTLISSSLLTMPSAVAADAGGDGVVTVVAVNIGSGSATATANGAGEVTPMDGSSPVVGDPAGGTIQTVGVSFATVGVIVNYSCPAGSPADAVISADVFQGQVSGTIPNPLPATCDGSVKTQVMTVSAQPLSYKPGPATIMALLFSPTNSGFGQNVTSQVTL